LSEGTFNAICDIPTANEARFNARQILCARLVCVVVASVTWVTIAQEDYVTHQHGLFSLVVAKVLSKFMPIIQVRDDRD
jgi:hypothetical protein